MPSRPHVRNTGAEGTVEEIAGRYVLRFERRLRHPREKVWDALTRPERMRSWFGQGEIELDLVEVGSSTSARPALPNSSTPSSPKRGRRR
jgi:uncharacterized protein YndB with AHSA1/START domain